MANVDPIQIRARMGRYLGGDRRALLVSKDMPSLAFYGGPISQLCEVVKAVSIDDVLTNVGDVQIVCVTVGNENTIGSLAIFQLLRANSASVPFVLLGKPNVHLRAPGDALQALADEQRDLEMAAIGNLHPANGPVYVPFGDQDIVREVVGGLTGWI